MEEYSDKTISNDHSNVYCFKCFDENSKLNLLDKFNTYKYDKCKIHENSMLTLRYCENANVWHKFFGYGVDLNCKVHAKKVIENKDGNNYTNTDNYVDSIPTLNSVIGAGISSRDSMDYSFRIPQTFKDYLNTAYNRDLDLERITTIYSSVNDDDVKREIEEYNSRFFIVNLGNGDNEFNYPGVAVLTDSGNNILPIVSNNIQFIVDEAKDNNFNVLFISNKIKYKIERFKVYTVMKQYFTNGGVD